MCRPTITSPRPELDSPVPWSSSRKVLALYARACVSRELSSNLSTKLRHALNNFQLRKLIRVAICLIIWSTERYRRGKACGRDRDTRRRTLVAKCAKACNTRAGRTLRCILMREVTIVTTCRLSLPLSLFLARWFQKLRTIVGFLQFRQRESVINGSRNRSDRVGQ